MRGGKSKNKKGGEQRLREILATTRIAMVAGLEYNDR
jgi:hypothetical protein